MASTIRRISGPFMGDHSIAGSIYKKKREQVPLFAAGKTSPPETCFHGQPVTPASDPQLTAISNAEGNEVARKWRKI